MRRLDKQPAAPAAQPSPTQPSPSLDCCTFCGTGRNDTEAPVRGNGACAICDKCVVVVADKMAEGGVCPFGKEEDEAGLGALTDMPAPAPAPIRHTAVVTVGVVFRTEVTRTVEVPEGFKAVDGEKLDLGDFRLDEAERLEIAETAYISLYTEVMQVESITVGHGDDSSLVEPGDD